MYIISNLMLTMTGIPSCFDYYLNLLWHSLHQTILSILSKVISNIDNYVLYNI